MSFVSKIVRNSRRILGLDPRHKVQIYCSYLRLGNYGVDWAISLDNLNKGAVVYSFGIGEDLSFELSLITKYQVKVWAFDPTPRSLEWVKKQKLPKQLRVMPLGIADYDGLASFKPPENKSFVSYRMIDNITKKAPKNRSDYADGGLEYPLKVGNRRETVNLPVLTLSSIMRKLKHKNVALLKMDIEGAEYGVIKYLFRKRFSSADQILVEFHHRRSGFRKEDTNQSVAQLNKLGYFIYNISETGTEYSFKKK